MTWHQFAGMPRKSYLPDHIEYVPNIVNPANFYQRPGYLLWGGTGSGTINHETDNYAVGADAQMHGRYLQNGPVDRSGNRMYVSWHFAVDGGSTAKAHGPTICQSIPCNEVSYQAACGACGGNNDRVSIEQCVNADGDRAAARDAHEWLTASIHETLGLPADPAIIDRHWDWNGDPKIDRDPANPDRHHCPDNMMTDGYWPTFEANVKAKYDQIVQFRIAEEGAPVPPKPEPTYAAAELPDWFTLQDALEHPSDQKFKGRTAYVCKRNYKALRGTVRRSAPDAKAPASGPKVGQGEKVFGIRLWVNPDTNQTWILEETGNWLLASKFSPRVRIDPRTVE